MQYRLRAQSSLRYFLGTFLFFFILFGFLLPASSEKIDLTDQERKWLAEHRTIRLAPNPDAPPLEFFDQAGKYQGISSDFVALIEQQLEIRFEVVKTKSWGEVLSKLKNKEVDMLGGATRTPDRCKFMLFSDTYAEFPSVLIVSASLEEALSIDDLAKMRVSVVSKSVDHDHISGLFPSMPLDQVDNVEVGLKKVSFGSTDVLVANLATAMYYIEKQGIINLRIAGQSGTPHLLAFACREDWPEFTGILNKALSAIDAETKRSIFQKWVHLYQDDQFTRHWGLPVAAIAALAIISFIILLWNRSLKTLVDERTRELHRELGERRRIEDSLRESEQRFRALVETTSDWVWEVDLNAVYTYVSPKVKELLGYEPEEVIGKKPFDFMEPDEAEKIKALFGKIAASCGPIVALENVNLHKSGRKVVIETSGVPIFGTGGQPLGYRGIDRDITGRKLSQRALREAHEQLERKVSERTAELILANADLQKEVAEHKKTQLRLESAHQQVQDIIDFLPDATFVINHEKKVISWNRAIEKMTGVRKEEILGKGDYAYAFPFYGKRRPILVDAIMDDAADIHGLYDNLERKGRYICGDVFVPNIDFGNGAYLWGIAAPLFDSDGNVIGAIQSIRDITDRKLTEQALKESEERFRTIFESAQECIFIKDKNLRLTFVNPAMSKIHGMPLEMLIGRTATEIFGEETGKQLDSEDFRVLAGEIVHTEHSKMMNGVLRTFDVIKVPISGSAGEINGICGISRDVTKRKETEKGLIQSEEQLRFLSSKLMRIQEEERKKVAQEVHDSLGQYLVGIKINIENLIRSGNMDQKIRAEKLKGILPIIQSALAEVRRIYTGLRPSTLDDLGIVSTIHWLCDEFQKTHSNLQIEKCIEIEREATPEHLSIVIFRIIQEALNNAAKYSDARVIYLSLVKQGNRIELTIEDDGVGFNPNEALSRNTHERGLGLTSMRERTEMSGGSFFLESVLGKGTMVRSTWPREA